MSGFVTRRAENTKPPGFYRTGLTIDDFRRVMSGKGPMSVTQISAELSPLVPVEAKVRNGRLSYGTTKSPVPTDINFLAEVGMRKLVMNKMPNYVRVLGKVRKHGSGKDAKYEWIEEAGPAKQDPAGRGHAKPPRTKRGRNPRVPKPDGSGDGVPAASGDV